MHLHFERNTNAKCDCAILSLTWMGKVPDELPEDEGWKLNRTNYYQEGWLATGNVRGIVGVTFTTSHCKKAVDFPLRTNYNLRGHRSEVILVKWNEPYQKLASCDSSGIIFVWIKYEGRWSIELINDRNTPVTHFSWSHDGRMALICYQDGFVLVGSVAGQRYWSSMLNLESTITCGIWTPDDQQVYFGTTSGQIIVMDVHGAMVSQMQIAGEIGITGMAWSCEKFKMEESDDADNMSTQSDNRMFILAVSLKNGFIYLMKNFDDVSPIQIHTGLYGISMEWSNSRELLAVAGAHPSSCEKPGEYVNILKFYSDTGILLYSVHVPYTQSPVTALTWGHNDKRLFIATGCQIHIAWVSRRIASLQLMCRLQIHNRLKGEAQVAVLPLPPRIKSLISTLFAQTIRCCVPEISQIREFVSRPPMGNIRLHCTMIRHADDTNLISGTCYTLYLEYLGGLVPLLKGKRTSKIRPEFVIFDPQVDETGLCIDSSPDSGKSSGSSQNGHATDTSDTEHEDSCASPRVQRRKRRRRKSHGERTEGDGDDLTYVDTLPDNVPLVEVTSNIWGTKFKIHGLASCLPANLGQVTYKTSLLHLQPRQMTLLMAELRDDILPEPDPNFNPNLFSEDEEEVFTDERSIPPGLQTDIAPIAPMSPRNQTNVGNRRYSHPKPSPAQQYIPDIPITLDNLPTLARPETYEDMDEFPYVDLTVNPEMVSFRESLRMASHESNCPYGQYSRQNAPQCTRHSISPLCCDSAQSPKHTVAPREVMEHAPSTIADMQLPSTDYGNVQRVKSSLVSRAHVERTDPISVENGKVDALELCSREHNGVDNAVMVRSMMKALDNKMHVVNGIDPDIAPIYSPKSSTKKKDRHYCGKQFSNQTGNQVAAAKWGGKPEDIRYIDEDTELSCERSICKTIPSSSRLSESMVRSCSVGYLDLVDAQMVPSDVAFFKDSPKRLVLVHKKKERPKPKLKQSGKSRSLDSSDIFPKLDGVQTATTKKSPKKRDKMACNRLVKATADDSSIRCMSDTSVSLSKAASSSKDSYSLLEKDEINAAIQLLNTSQISNGDESPRRRGEIVNDLSRTMIINSSDGMGSPRSLPPPSPSPRTPHSSPASPALSKKSKRNQSSSPIRKHLLNSPLLNRRQRKNKAIESSDDEIIYSGDEIINGKNYKDLESFQKAQLRQKLKRGKCKQDNGESSPSLPRRREFVMHNKAPLWNENSQVYQLDFGGRVTQESAKNFQIEFRGKQVMQFGRIDGNAYTLDFQYPFSALQAFAVALANVTQRLK